MRLAGLSVSYVLVEILWEKAGTLTPPPKKICKPLKTCGRL